MTKLQRLGQAVARLRAYLSLMKNLIPAILLWSSLGAQAAVAQALISNGSQTGVVQAPAAQAPTAQAPSSFSAAVPQQPVIAPQMPTSTNMPGSAPAIATPVPGASPGVPVLNAPSAQAAPSPAP